jgi:hypothetical protein
MFVTSDQVDSLILTPVGNIFHKKNPPFIAKTTDLVTIFKTVRAVSS